MNGSLFDVSIPDAERKMLIGNCTLDDLTHTTVRNASGNIETTAKSSSEISHCLNAHVRYSARNFLAFDPELNFGLI